MKVEKPSPNPQRKVSVWSREKINNLIELYRKHECLWNHWHESYKSREKRNRAIEEICRQLRISKFDFGKKIHNLRNQFNTEMKKLEQRIEESGGETVVDDSNTSTAARCKWSHFEALMFLRHVIEPRPGGYQSTMQAPKKMRLRFDYNSADDDVNVTMVPGNTSTSSNNDDATQYQYEDNGTDDGPNEDYQNFDNELTEVVQSTREENFDQKYKPLPILQQPTPPQQHHSISTINPAITSMPRTYIQTNSNQKTTQTLQHASASSTNPSAHTEIINLSHDSSSIVELNPSNLSVVSANPSTLISSSVSVSAPNSSSALLNTPAISSVASAVNNTNTTSMPSDVPVRRDQWDAFGELVASEFRNLNSDISRKRLKRKIMQAMLEVGEEDDVM